MGVRSVGAGLAALALLVSGCASDQDPGLQPAEAPESSATAEPSETPEATPYLPVGDVRLTDPGTELDLRQPATIAWERRQGAVGAARVTVVRVDRTSYEESFRGWVVTDAMRGSTPLFVHVRVANVGERDLKGWQLPLTVVDDTGIRVQQTVAKEAAFTPCPAGALPANRFPTGAKADLCLIYLLEPKRTFAGVSYQPPGLEGIVWRGELTRVPSEQNPPRQSRL